MIKAILFDLDNTLIDFYTFKTKCIESAVKAMIKAGLKTDMKKAESIILSIYTEFGMEYKDIFQELMRRISGKVDYRILNHGLIAYRNERKNHLSAYPGVKSAIKKLHKKYKIAIISDAPGQKAWMRIVLLGIEKDLDVVVTFDDTHQRKPSPLPFQKAIKILKAKPREILMVGDSIHRDMSGAKALGMKTCLATYGRTLKPMHLPENTDFMISKISDLMKVVKKA